MQRPAQTAPTSSPNARSYQQMLTKLLRHGAYAQLRKIVDKTLPADLSPVLPLLLEEDRNRVLSLLIEAGKAARALLELDDSDLHEILDPLDDSTVASICSSSAPDDAADLLDTLDDDRRQRVLELLGATQGAKLESLLEGEEETAGSLMNIDFLALDEELTVAQAIEAIRQYPRKDSFFYVYCIDAEAHLVGVLSLRSLILAPPDSRLSTSMVQSVVRTQVDSAPEEVAQLVSKYDLLSIPVVDHQNRLVGVVTVDDVLDVIQEQAEEDLLHLAGVDVSERVTTPAWDSFKSRLPWLAINLATAFLASWVVRLFQGTIEKWAALAVFMPIVAGMGGNAGTQTLTVFVRGLALGEVDWNSGWRPIAKEVLVGFGNGFANGLLTMLIVGFWTGDWVLAGILFLAMIFNLIVSGFAGGLVPLVLERLGFDPAIASSIFVTTFTDVGGFFSFLGLASVAMKYFAHS
ncbi:MAG TPA: magnesium transporter [Thermoanaerobaculia bacterium]|jgi:magnesium transporter|nr:magnesium transporter [Thermoanaerobaculia bacterium]